MIGLFPLLAYFLGSIPFGLLVARLKGVDITKEGSGNIGATNVARVIGKKEGLLVLVLDASKGFTAVYLPFLFGQDEVVIGLSALLVLVGNVASIFMRFRGGKGIATGVGALLGLSVKVFGEALLIFFFVAATTGYVSLASLSAFAALPFLFLVEKNPVSALVGASFFFIALVRHRQNIKRLLKREEPRTFRDLFKKAKSQKGKRE